MLLFLDKSTLIRAIALLVFLLPIFSHSNESDPYSDLFDMSILELMQQKVTVQKREESISAVPVSVTLLTSHDIENGDIQNVSALELLAPGVRYGESGSDARLSIRGTRTNDIRTGSAQVVGVFIDGVYIPSTTQALSQFLDVERIEVVRGPQGLLYGRNTFGGAINVISHAPSDSLEYKAQITVGDYNRMRTEALVNIPLSTQLQLRVAGMREVQDGYVENLHGGNGDNLKDENQWAFKSALRFNPSNHFEATLRVNRSLQDKNGNGDFGYMVLGSVINPTTGLTDINGDFVKTNPRNGTFGSTPDKGPYAIYRDYPNSVKTETNHANLTINASFKYGIIKSISAYNDFSIDQWVDGDLSDTPFAAVGTPSHSKDYFQEFQLLSTDKSPFEWLLGSYYQFSRMGDRDDTYGAYIYDEFQSAIDHDNTSTTPTSVTGTPTPEYEWATLDETTLTIRSLFAQLGYTAFDNLHFSGGIRFNRETRKADSWYLPMSWSPEATKVDSNENTWDNITWRSGIDYTLSNNALVYASVSTGFRTGGFNSSNGSIPTFNEETVTAYEMGFKTPLLDNSLQINSAVFYNRYREMQSQELVTVDKTVLPYTSNAGAIDAMGLEADLDWIPSPHWNIGATVSLLEATFGDYIVSNPFEQKDSSYFQSFDPAVWTDTVEVSPDSIEISTDLTALNYVNLKESTVPLSPTLTASIQISYKFVFANGVAIIPYLQTYYSSSFWTNDINAPGTEQEAYTKSDLRLSLVSPKKNVSLQLYIKNIENTAVLNRTIISTSGRSHIWANYQDPRTMGLTVKMSY
ncbi:MAG: TonB-dependent receptor [Fibrobacterales bacterium]